MLKELTMPNLSRREEDARRAEQASIDYKRYLILALSAGASLILGLLAFGGMYALWPALIPAASGFTLSVVYEFEIYSQNLTRAFEKLFSRNYFEKQLPKYYLHHYFQTQSQGAERLAFFEEYEKALRAKDTELLDYLEALFDEQINNTEDAYRASAYRYNQHTEALHAFLRAEGVHDQYKKSSERRKIYIPALQFFALLTTLSMSLGTSYLLVEFFSLVPWLAAIPAVLPVIIVPLSILGGVAYGLLTFNAVTNLMANNTVVNWARKIRNNFYKDGLTLANITMAATATLLFALALTLTICTAGTWWTIAQQVRPLFGWMRRIPTFFMAVVNPVIMWFSSLAFNVENTSGTLHELFPEHDKNDPVDKSPSPWENIKTACSNTAQHMWEKENIGQWLNPFRPMLYLVLSLRYVLFAGHLLSIGATADRIPKLSQYVSSCLGGLSEGFEDWDYFFGEHRHPQTLHALLHDRLGESQGHNHDQDLPTKLVNLCAIPFYYASAHWHAYFSTFNRDEATHMTYETSWEKLHEAFIPQDETKNDDCHCAARSSSQRAESFKNSFQLPTHCKPCIPKVRFFTAGPSQVNQRNLDTEVPALNPAQGAHLENLVHSGCSVM